MRMSLLLAASALAAGLALAPAEGRADCSNSPVEAVEAFEEFFPTDQADCAKACKRWVRSCRGLAKRAAQCQKRVIQGLNRYDREDCNTLDGESRKDCVRNAKADLKAASDVNKSERRIALADCDASAPDCVSTCTDDD
ncbi:MAG: hypothetical protein QNK03_21890 [Myxococcota bacterium]|nr:hypothetical protein [Myxococcota bacterium]